jgi:hypothetical protein
MAFNAEYAFQVSGKEVVIQHRAPNDNFQKHLRVAPGDLEKADMNGGTGDLARWKVHLEDGGSKCRVQSVKTGKYLRIKDGGNDIDVNGGPGLWTLFKVHKQGGGIVKLESNHFPGKYFAVQPKGPAVGTGGKWCDLKFFRQGGGGGGGGGEFTKPYEFAKTNTIVIMHKGGGDWNQFLRIDPNNHEQANHAGGKGALAQMEADPQDGGSRVRIKSIKSGKYLRIMGGDKVNFGGGGGKFTVFKVHKAGHGPQGGRLAKLESVEFPGKYIAVGKNNEVRVGVGGPWCDLQFFRKN